MRRIAILFTLLLAGASAFAQNVPNSQLWGAGWNDIAVNTQPSPWCPKDSAGNVATLTSFRMWDDGVKWDQVEGSASSPTDTTGYTFGKLDWAMSSNIATHAGCNMKMLYQFGATPNFIAAGGTNGTCANVSTVPNSANYSCVQPSDVNGTGGGADAWWLNYVGQVALRYSGKSGSLGHMAYWGTWNEADSSNFWCVASSPCGGSTASLKNLVLMAWDMHQLTRCIDSTSRVVSPDGHVGSMLTWFHNFTTTSINAPARSITITPPSGASYAPITCSWSAQTVTGANTYDIVDEHMRGTQSTNSDPTSVIAAYNVAVTEMTNDGLLSYPLWNDEWGYNQGQVPNIASAAAYVAISESLMASFSSPNISQENFYLWDSNNFPLSQTVGGLANDIVAGWLLGNTVNNYSVSGTIYSIPGTLAAGGSFKIMFDKSGTCGTGAFPSTCTAVSNQSAGSFTHYTDLGGTVHTVTGGVVPVGYAPIILTGAGGGGTTAATPTCSPNGGTFSATQNPTCSTTSAGAHLCYNFTGAPSTSGSGCGAGSTLYSGAISIGTNETLYVVAGGPGFTDSAIYTGVFQFHGSAPTFSPPGATYTGSQTVTLSNAQGLSMAYTTDGSTPTSDGSGHITHGTAYTVPLVVASSEIIKAIGYLSGWTDSPVGSATYVINYTLSVSVSGLGSVSSSPIGINACSSTGGTCSGLFNQGTSITLTATPGSGYSFAGWSGGGCSGTGGCTLTLNSSTSVTATFSVIIPAITVGQPAAIIMQ